MTEKYSLLPAQSYPLTPAQTALQCLSEKHPDFEIQPVNTIRPPEIEYTQTSQALVPTDTPLSIIRKHIPQQSDINKIVKSMCDTWIRITNPGTRSHKSISNINTLLRHLSSHNRLKITIWCKSSGLYLG